MSTPEHPQAYAVIELDLPYSGIEISQRDSKTVIKVPFVAEADARHMVEHMKITVERDPKVIQGTVFKGGHAEIAEPGERAMARQITDVADPLIAASKSWQAVQAEVWAVLGVGIGIGGSGPVSGIKSCPYCGAYGGGGHGGLCPRGMGDDG